MTDQNKLLRFLFLKLVFLLRERNEVVLYGEPQYSSAETGFAITMYKVDHKAYDYVTECFGILGKKPSRECGVTMSVTFDTVEENIEFKKYFKSLMQQAQSRFKKLCAKTPDEHYFLKLNPVFLGIEDTQNNHFILLQAHVVDDVDERVLSEVLGDYEIVDMPDDEPVEIRVKCYRKKWRNGLVRHLIQLGIEENL